MRTVPFLLPALLAFAALPGAPLADDDSEVLEGKPAPSFMLKTMNPEQSNLTWVSLDRFVGSEPEDDKVKAVLLSFFASWCGPCKKEMPFLQQLHMQYREAGLRVISVDIDKEEPGLSDAKKLIDANKVTYPVLSDRFNFLARRYLGDKSPLPSVFILKKDGTIALIKKGYEKDASAFLTAEVQKALGIEKGPRK
jgi:thiol-disulfide isomerase/thioredoxin